MEFLTSGVDYSTSKQIIGLVAAVCLMVSFFPQAVKTIKTRDTAGISFIMYVLYMTGSIFMITYAIVPSPGSTVKDSLLTPILIANGILFIESLIIFGIKINNIIKGKEKLIDSVAVKKSWSEFTSKFRKK